eukprot:GHVL01007975.1.p1 GENE.GHVL01007975.1~~GHVL01007975.1.p1  ORF type:complete len:1212 (+),score=389.98 GHVL01007975.1:438-3638(+)
MILPPGDTSDVSPPGEIPDIDDNMYGYWQLFETVSRPTASAFMASTIIQYETDIFDENKIIWAVHGGLISENEVSDELWFFDGKKWIKQNFEITGGPQPLNSTSNNNTPRGPGARYGHTLVTMKPSDKKIIHLIMIGGIEKIENNFLMREDIFIAPIGLININFKNKNYIWKNPMNNWLLIVDSISNKIQTNDKIKYTYPWGPVVFHCTEIVDENIYIFGGITPQGLSSKIINFKPITDIFNIITNDKNETDNGYRLITGNLNNQQNTDYMNLIYETNDRSYWYLFRAFSTVIWSSNIANFIIFGGIADLDARYRDMEFDYGLLVANNNESMERQLENNKYQIAQSTIIILIIPLCEEELKKICPEWNNINNNNNNNITNNNNNKECLSGCRVGSYVTVMGSENVCHFSKSIDSINWYNSITPPGYISKSDPICMPCDIGSYTMNDQLNVSCKLCPPGFYSLTHGASSYKTCIPCPYGTYSYIKSCIKCPKNSICPIGSYKILYKKKYNKKINIINEPHGENIHENHLSWQLFTFSCGLCILLFGLCILCMVHVKAPNKVNSWMRQMDFRPITGTPSEIPTEAGGVLTLAYLILSFCVLCLATTHHLLFNYQLSAISIPGIESYHQSAIKPMIVFQIKLNGFTGQCTSSDNQLNAGLTKDIFNNESNAGLENNFSLVDEHPLHISKYLSYFGIKNKKLNFFKNIKNNIFFENEIIGKMTKNDNFEKYPGDVRDNTGFSECHRSLYFNGMKDVSCFKSESGCIVRAKCENCTIPDNEILLSGYFDGRINPPEINNTSVKKDNKKFSISTTQPIIYKNNNYEDNFFISAQSYDWSLSVFWNPVTPLGGNNKTSVDAYSQISSLLVPEEEDFIFKGETPGVIDLAAIPADYTNEPKNVRMGGFVLHFVSAKNGTQVNQETYHNEPPRVAWEVRCKISNFFFRLRLAATRTTFDILSGVLGLLSGMSLIVRCIVAFWYMIPARNRTRISRLWGDENPIIRWFAKTLCYCIKDGKPESYIGLSNEDDTNSPVHRIRKTNDSLSGRGSISEELVSNVQYPWHMSKGYTEEIH